MVDKAKVDAAVKELGELKEMFEKIRTDSEELFKRSKALSETGVHEAQELIDAVKTNWAAVVKSFSGNGGLASLLGKVFSKKKPKSADKAIRTVKKTAKKVARKTK